MRVGMSINYAGGFAETVTELADYEKAGLGIVFVPEAYSFDAVSQLGYIAARTERLQIASGILQLYSRTPALTAMTAAGLDYVSGGRFTLGIGASGPQVIEGWHGVPYDAPVGRSRELIEICRMVWRRERLSLPGQALPDPAAAGRRHRARQAAQADQPPGARAYPDRARRRRAEERRARRRAGRGLAAVLLFPGEGGRGLGRPGRRGPGQAGSVPGPARRDRPGAGDDRRRRGQLPRPGPPVLRPVHRRHGGARPQLLQHAGPAPRLRSRGDRGSRTPTWTAARTRRRPWSPPSCWRRPH